MVFLQDFCFNKNPERWYGSCEPSREVYVRLSWPHKWCIFLIFFNLVKVFFRKLKSRISHMILDLRFCHVLRSEFILSYYYYELAWLKWHEGLLFQSENWLVWLYNLLFLESLPLNSLSCTFLIWKCVIVVQHLEGETEVTLKSVFTVCSFYHLQANLLE